MTDKTLQELIDQLRANGVTNYRGPLQPMLGTAGTEVELSLGAAPRAVAEPEMKTPRQPEEPPKRGADGLTAPEQIQAYGVVVDA